MPFKLGPKVGVYNIQGVYSNQIFMVTLKADTNEVSKRSIAVSKPLYCYANSDAIWDHNTVLPATWQW